MRTSDLWEGMGLPPLGNLSRPLKNLDALMECFLLYRGLYVVGSGASLPHVPLARRLDELAVSAFLHGGSYSGQHANPDGRTRRMTGAYKADRYWDHVWDRPIWPGAINFAPELLGHMSSEQGELHLLRAVTQARLDALPSADLHEIDGARVFRAFCPGQVMVYNLDGLLNLRSPHVVRDMHGISPDFLVTEEAAEWIEMIHDGDSFDFLGDVNIDRRESPDDPHLAYKLEALWSFDPKFIAIIGYTFARQGDDDYNDWVSLREFIRRFRFSRGNIFVIDPFPDPLCELLHKKLPGTTVVPVPVMWNLLAGAFIDCHAGLAPGRSVTERYRELEWKFGSAGPARREKHKGAHRHR